MSAGAEKPLLRLVFGLSTGVGACLGDQSHAICRHDPCRPSGAPAARAGVGMLRQIDCYPLGVEPADGRRYRFAGVEIGADVPVSCVAPACGERAAVVDRELNGLQVSGVARWKSLISAIRRSAVRVKRTGARDVARVEGESERQRRAGPVPRGLSLAGSLRLS